MIARASWFLAFSVSLTLSGGHAQTVDVIVGEQASVVDSVPPGELKSPFGVDFDRGGNMYIVELEGGRVHRVDTKGTLSLIAGDGSTGYAGDGGAASKATFNGMHNVAVTPNGDVYISDSWNHCIRKIDGGTGIIDTIAGTGEPGFAGDGGPAEAAQFNFLMCVSLNSGNDKLYFADLKNRRIRSMDLKSGLVATVAGNGKKGVPVDGSVARDSPLVDPRAVAVDSNENVYVLERGGHALRKVTPDGKIWTVAGTGKAGDTDGPALMSEFRSPKHLAVDSLDRVIIADDGNAAIRLFDPKSGSVATILGKGVSQPNVSLHRPHGVCVHEDGSLVVVDTGHHRILRLSEY